MLCAADVHVHGEDHPTWQQLVGEPGRRIRDDYRKAAAWLVPRLTVPAGQAPVTDRAEAVGSCPGRELDPNPCRCPCYGCKHHCAAHNPDGTDLTEADIDRMMAAGTPVQIVTGPPATHGANESTSRPDQATAAGQNLTFSAPATDQTAPVDRAAAELATARDTNRRLNLRAQRLESELAAYRRAVGQWEVSDRGTYIPHSSLRAIGLASGKDILGSVRHLKHFERVEQAEAAIERVRLLHDNLVASAELTSPDDPITRGAAAKRIAAALGGWTEPAAASAVVVRRATDETPGEAVCVCGHPMQQHFEDVCLTECGCNDGLEADSDADLPDRLAVVLTARFTELGNPHSRMVVHEQGPDGWPATHPVGPHGVAEVLRELLAEQPAIGAQEPKQARP
jgi:hypothetical protein